MKTKPKGKIIGKEKRIPKEERFHGTPRENKDGMILTLTEEKKSALFKA